MQGAYLVNTARGAIVDRDSLVNVMKDGHLAGQQLSTDIASSLQWCLDACESNLLLRKDPKLSLLLLFAGYAGDGEHSPASPRRVFICMTVCLAYLLALPIKT